MQINANPPRYAEKTHEGAQAARITPKQALRRSVMSCFLWEDEFYEDGQAIVDRIKALTTRTGPMGSPLINPGVTAAIAIEARHVAKLRHVPLLL